MLHFNHFIAATTFSSSIIILLSVMVMIFVFIPVYIGPILQGDYFLKCVHCDKVFALTLSAVALCT